jgi:hypothetical protein
VKILLDAQLSHDIAEILRSRGHGADAVTARGDLPDDLPDEEVMAVADREERVVVTNNVKDLRRLAAGRLASGKGHAGLILVSPNTPRSKAANKPLADAIERLINSNPDGLAGSERWI